MNHSIGNEDDAIAPIRKAFASIMASQASPSGDENKGKTKTNTLTDVTDEDMTSSHNLDESVSSPPDDVVMGKGESGQVDGCHRDSMATSGNKDSATMSTYLISQSVHKTKKHMPSRIKARKKCKAKLCESSPSRPNLSGMAILQSPPHATSSSIKVKNHSAIQKNGLPDHGNNKNIQNMECQILNLPPIQQSDEKRIHKHARHEKDHDGKLQRPKRHGHKVKETPKRAATTVAEEATKTPHETTLNHPIISKRNTNLKSPPPHTLAATTNVASDKFAHNDVAVDRKQPAQRPNKSHALESMPGTEPYRMHSPQATLPPHVSIMEPPSSLSNDVVRQGTKNLVVETTSQTAMASFATWRRHSSPENSKCPSTTECTLKRKQARRKEEPQKESTPLYCANECPPTFLPHDTNSTVQSQRGHLRPRKITGIESSDCQHPKNPTARRRKPLATQPSRTRQSPGAFAITGTNEELGINEQQEQSSVLDAGVEATTNFMGQVILEAKNVVPLESKTWYGVFLVVGLAATIATALLVTLIIVLSENHQTRTSHEQVLDTTTDTVTKACFMTKKELTDAIAQYLIDNSSASAVARTYGHPIGAWDVSHISDFGEVFYTTHAETFNESLNAWNVSSATSMNSMFAGAPSFNQPLNDWNVSSVSNMTKMFSGATSFNQPLNDWEVSAVIDMSHMFYGASGFNQSLNNWDVSLVKHMNRMFVGASSFNQPLIDWDVSAVEDMNQLFLDALSFNQPLNAWNVSSVTSMSAMFAGAKSFNCPLNAWDVSAAQDMAWMFHGASSFNQPLSNWMVSSVVSMKHMFAGASAFQQPLCSWGKLMHPFLSFDDSIFEGTACPDTDRPRTSSNPPGPWCFPCETDEEMLLVAVTHPQ